MKEVKIKTSYYQQFDADLQLDVPGEGYGGWKTAVLPFDLDSTGFVFMHAWNFGTPQQYPGWHRACEFFPRADKIIKKAFPPLLKALRGAGMKIYHVAADGAGLDKYPGVMHTVPLPAGFVTAPRNENYTALQEFRRCNVFVGRHNEPDVERGYPYKNFHPKTVPIYGEPVFLDDAAMAATLAADGVNHLVYSGFAINWCLFMSPCGMVDMGRRGFICSAVRDAVTAVENKESARTEAHKEEALWRTALSWGFVFDVAEIIKALKEEIDS